MIISKNKSAQMQFTRTTKLGFGLFLVLVSVFIVLLATGVFASTAPAPAPAPAPAVTPTKKDEWILESTETDKCYVGEDVEINCLPPDASTAYTYATFKRGSETERRKVPCKVSVQCIVPPADTDVELRVSPGFVRDIDAAGKESEIFKQLCEADYNCPSDPIYQPLPGLKDEVMDLELRFNCHNPGLFGTCIDQYFDMMKATAWKPNPALQSQSLSDDARKAINDFARNKEVPVPTEVLTLDDKVKLGISSLSIDRFRTLCAAKGYEFAKNCKRECTGRRFDGPSQCPAPPPSAGALRAGRVGSMLVEVGSMQVSRSPPAPLVPQISGMPQVHNFPLSLRRLSDSYCA